MRSSYWLVIAALIVGASIIAFWPTTEHIGAAVPGQYPLDKKRFNWPSMNSTGHYRPIGMGSDTVAFSTGDDKFVCGTSKTCRLPTVPYVTPYEPTLLQE